jgi:hypothetical protein
MIEEFGIPRKKDGKKTRIRCSHCPRVMRAAAEWRWIAGRDGMKVRARVHSWEIDRIPVCGHDGGRYLRTNVAPACRDCNQARCTVTKKCRAGAPTNKWKARKTARHAA